MSSDLYLKLGVFRSLVLELDDRKVVAMAPPKSLRLDDSNFKQNSGWHCNVDTTFGLIDANSLPFQNFIKGAIRGLNEYLRHLGIDQPVSYGVECWLNRYNKNQHQELHNHAGACTGRFNIFFLGFDVWQNSIQFWFAP